MSDKPFADAVAAAAAASDVIPGPALTLLKSAINSYLTPARVWKIPAPLLNFIDQHFHPLGLPRDREGNPTRTQQDTTEFLTFLLGSLGAAGSSIMDTVTAIFNLHQTCKNCANVRPLQPQPVQIVTLRLPPDVEFPSVKQLFTFYCSANHNELRCDQPGCAANRGHREEYLPEYLPSCLLLNVARHAYVNGTASKDRRPVRICRILELHTAAQGPLRYRLYGVLVHAGESFQSGHYYAVARCSSSVSSADPFFTLNDADIAVTGLNSPPWLNSVNSYVLFYALATPLETELTLYSSSRPRTIMSRTLAFYKDNLHIQGVLLDTIAYSWTLATLEARYTEFEPLLFPLVDGDFSIDDLILFNESPALRNTLLIVYRKVLFLFGIDPCSIDDFTLICAGDWQERCQYLNGHPDSDARIIRILDCLDLFDFKRHSVALAAFFGDAVDRGELLLQDPNSKAFWMSRIDK